MEMVHFIPPSQRRVAMLAAQADNAPVLIHGLNGTGKSALAKWIHLNSPRSTKTLLVAQSGKSLVEQIRSAEGGTLIIPEIGERPLGEQKALLTFLQTKTIPHPETDEMPMLINVRIIATTSQTLEGRAQGGLFNGELLKKLNVFRIEMPSLAKRDGEFEDIVTGIMGEITREIHKEHLKNLSPEVWKVLKSYDWPGNLRELRNVLRVAVVSCHGDVLEKKDLPDFGHDRMDFRATREQFEKNYLVELLKTFDWQIDKTCQVSRIDKATMLSKIKKYGIEFNSML